MNTGAFTVQIRIQLEMLFWEMRFWCVISNPKEIREEIIIYLNHPGTPISELFIYYHLTCTDFINSWWWRSRPLPTHTDNHKETTQGHSSCIPRRVVFVWHSWLNIYSIGIYTTGQCALGGNTFVPISPALWSNFLPMPRLYTDWFVRGKVRCKVCLSWKFTVTGVCPATEECMVVNDRNAQCQYYIVWL